MKSETTQLLVTGSKWPPRALLNHGYFFISLVIFFMVMTERENAAAAGSTAMNPDSNGKPVIQSGRGGRKKSRLAAAASTATTTTANPSGMDLDLPVDPNEPTYCLCNQVSYGEMVACDNPDCKIEWFHYGCVGLKEQPKGKWYCNDCSGNQKRRKGK